MNKIPKEIVDKIEQRNTLNEEIAEWCKENLDMDGMDSDFADITSYHSGEEQGDQSGELNQISSIIFWKSRIRKNWQQMRRG